jgi:hypothetical protein
VDNTFPVELLSFDARLINKKVDVSWSTASEINCDYFVVQRSGDGKIYEDIAQLKGAGNSTQANYYSTADYSPLVGINYYRLCQVDFDGTRTNYLPKVVKVNGRNSVVVYPSPAKSQDISILFTGEKPINAVLEVRDLSGKLMTSNEHLALVNGFNKLDLGDRVFSAGTYFFSVIINDEVYHQKVILEN